MGRGRQVYDPIDTAAVSPWAILSNHEEMELEHEDRDTVMSQEKREVRNCLVSASLCRLPSSFLSADGLSLPLYFKWHTAISLFCLNAVVSEICKTCHICSNLKFKFPVRSTLLQLLLFLLPGFISHLVSFDPPTKSEFMD